MLKSSILACLLLQLAKSGNFPVDSKEDEKLIGGILSRHLLQSRFNTFDYSPLYNEKKLRTLGGVGSSSSVLLDLYPTFASTLNHSCKANARLESPNNQHVCLQATQPISAGTEITIPYVEKDYLKAISSSTTSGLFKDRYLVTCFCARCTYYTRNTPFGRSDYLSLSCSDCGHLMEHSSKQRSESDVFRCTNCRLTMTNSEVKRRYLKFDQLSKQFCQLYLSGENQVWKLKEIVEQLDGLLTRDSGMLCLYQSTLYGYYMSNGQMDKAWACLEQFLSIYEHMFGEESVSLLDAIDFVQNKIFLLNPMTMKVFEQQDKEYQRYLARMEQSKQLKRKYYLDY